jgi:hypothetical protein
LATSSIRTRCDDERLFLGMEESCIYAFTA